MDQPFARIPGQHDDDTRRQAIEAAAGRLRRATRAANLGPFTGYRIGLDIGNGNIGWCVLFEDGSVPHFLTAEDIAACNAALPPDATRTQLPDLASFVPLGTHKFDGRTSDGKALSKVRAEARARRRTLDARGRRRRHLRRVLEAAGLFPRDDTSPGSIKGLKDPATGQPVKADMLRVLLLQPGAAAHPHDLGRALYNALKRHEGLVTVTIDGHPRHGFTTGVSAEERALLWESDDG